MVWAAVVEVAVAMVDGTCDGLAAPWARARVPVL